MLPAPSFFNVPAVRSSEKISIWALLPATNTRRSSADRASAESTRSHVMIERIRPRMIRLICTLPLRHLELYPGDPPACPLGGAGKGSRSRSTRIWASRTLSSPAEKPIWRNRILPDRFSRNVSGAPVTPYACSSLSGSAPTRAGIWKL